MLRRWSATPGPTNRTGLETVRWPTLCWLILMTTTTTRETTTCGADLLRDAPMARRLAAASARAVKEGPMALRRAVVMKVRRRAVEMARRRAVVMKVRPRAVEMARRRAVVVIRLADRAGIPKADRRMVGSEHHRIISSADRRIRWILKCSKWIGKTPN